MSSAELPARFAPEIPFPAYAFVPGRHPHPVTHPDGHSYGLPEASLPEPDAESLNRNLHFRFGMDLFNHGYYWEAHETWEGLWLASGRRGKLADFLKALIRLAAAGVKAREGNQAGVIKHAQRAAELFGHTDCGKLKEIALALAAQPVVDTSFTTQGYPVVGIELKMEDFEFE
jgi:hypothetical protein